MSFRLLTALLVILSCSTCTKQNSKPFCKLAIKVASATADGIGSAFDCANRNQMVADFSEPILNIDVCKEEMQTGALAILVCPILGKYVSDVAVKSLPKSWECKGGPAADSIKVAAAAACMTAIHF